jgi:hypothetical protein
MYGPLNVKFLLYFHIEPGDRPFGPKHVNIFKRMLFYKYLCLTVVLLIMQL